MDRQCNCTLITVTQRYLATYRRILDEMRCGMTDTSLTDSISRNFIVQMIPHHRAAIEMSENIPQYPTCVLLQEIAEGIIAKQTQNIADMEAILPICSMETSPGSLPLPVESGPNHKHHVDSDGHSLFRQQVSAQ